MVSRERIATALIKLRLCYLLATKSQPEYSAKPSSASQRNAIRKAISLAGPWWSAVRCYLGVSRDKTHFMNRLKTIYSSLFDPPLMNMKAESWSTLSGMVMVR